MSSLPLSEPRSASRRFWVLTTWAAIAVLAGAATGILGFSRLAASGLAPEFGVTLLYLFVGTQVILIGVVLYMYSLFEARRMQPDRIERVLADYTKRLPETDPRRKDLPSGKGSRWRHVTPVLIIGQSLVVLTLLAWLSAEFQSNVYMENWVERNFPVLRFVLDRYFVVLLFGVFVGAVLIYFLQRKSREERLLEYLRKLE